MKSAYELAMERLAQSEPTDTPLTTEQKTRLAEIDKVYVGRIAEREIFLKQSLEKARVDGNLDEIEKIQKQLASERINLEADRDAEKEHVRRTK